LTVRRGTEVAITALTRNQLVRVTWHMGSNPILSANQSSKEIQSSPNKLTNQYIHL
jgi:hypothetical protein